MHNVEDILYRALGVLIMLVNAFFIIKEIFILHRFFVLPALIGFFVIGLWLSLAGTDEYHENE